MISLTTDRRTELARQKLKSSNCYSFTKGVYINDYSNEVPIDDLQYPVNVKEYAEPPKFANVGYEPAVADCRFNIINKNGIYSPKNTDSDFNDIFVKDRQIKFYDGKKLKELGNALTAETNLENSFLYFTKISEDSLEAVDGIVLDEDNAAGNTEDYFNDLFDGSTSKEGYFVATLNRSYPRIEQWNNFVVNANSQNGVIYYRYGNDLDELNILGSVSTLWTNAGGTAIGDKTVTLDIPNNYKYLQVAVVIDVSEWSNPIQINSITLNYNSYIDWILLGTFFLDRPLFQDKEGAELSVASITGRNSWKRAINSKINIEDLSGGVGLTQFIKDVCDLSNLTYSTTSIADLSAFGNRTLADGYEEEVPVKQIFDDIMLIIGKTYRMRVDRENVIYVELRPTAFLADWVFSFKNYLNADQKYVYDKQIQRITAMTKSQVVDAVELLGSDTFTLPGDQTISWAGGAIAKYYKITAQAGDVNITDISMNNESVVFTITGAPISITLEVWGNKFSGDEPDFYGESADNENLINNNGLRLRKINPLLISDAECKTVTENLVDDYGQPAYEVTINDAYLNMFPETNDPALFISEDFFEDSIYEVIAVERIANGDVKKTSKFTLLDTGRRLSDEGAIIYDRGYRDSSLGAIQYDKGYIYDASYRIGVTRSEILAQKTYITNIGFN